MHNIKDIRKNLEEFKNGLKNRFVDIDIKSILSLDENNRKLIQKKEILEKEKKDISKKKDSNLFEKSKDITKQISKYTNEQSKIKIELNKLLSSIPNIALKDVPVGKNENSNKEILTNGVKRKFKYVGF